MSDDIDEGTELPTTTEPTETEGGAGTGERSRSPLAYLRRRHDPLTSLVLVVPVFLIYHLGILLIDLRNGVDLVSNLTLQVLEQSLGAYVGVTLGLAAALIGAGFWLRKKGRVDVFAFGPVLAESTVWAVLMLFSVGWAVQQVMPQAIPPLAVEPLQVGHLSMGPLTKLVMAAGAGFHEELIFRVALFGGGALALQRLPALEGYKGVLIAGVLAAMLFSGIHYIGELGDAFTFTSFFFRFLAGIYLTVVFRFRGFAVAVYTHAIYDLLVFFVL